MMWEKWEEYVVGMRVGTEKCFCVNVITSLGGEDAGKIFRAVNLVTGCLNKP